MAFAMGDAVIVTDRDGTDHPGKVVGTRVRIEGAAEHWRYWVRTDADELFDVEETCVRPRIRFREFL